VSGAKLRGACGDGGEVAVGEVEAADADRPSAFGEEVADAALPVWSLVLSPPWQPRAGNDDNER